MGAGRGILKGLSQVAGEAGEAYANYKIGKKDKEMDELEKALKIRELIEKSQRKNMSIEEAKKWGARPKSITAEGDLSYEFPQELNPLQKSQVSLYRARTRELLKPKIAQKTSTGSSPTDSSTIESTTGIPTKLTPPEKFTEGESKLLAGSNIMKDEIQQIKNILNSATSTKAQFLSSIPFAKGFGNEQAQELDLLKKDVGDRLLRLRSGAAITEGEYKRFADMLPQLFRKDSVDLAQLDRFLNEFQGIERRVTEGRNYQPDVGIGSSTSNAGQGDIDIKIQQAKNAGYTDAEIQAYLNRR